MSTNSFEDVPPWVRRAVLVTIVAYFALVIYATATGDPVANLTADALFGVVAIGIGGMLFLRAADRTSPLAAAGFSLITGGIAQFAWVVSREPAFELLSTIAVLFGIGLYAYVIWAAS
ncbi:hypothetical protein [Salinilacihabitans rarus]|uniref:hypothetical protein n=1 Tax=Salinilacihabitans rarus TaxID=2961596 RepID=UPI0020C8E58B|nr:hypothetical protein [Salinilacihabitans rarus]